MDVNGVVGYVSLALSIAGLILGYINHTRLRSNCCGREAVVSLDIDKSSPLLNGTHIKATARGSEEGKKDVHITHA